MFYLNKISLIVKRSELEMETMFLLTNGCRQCGNVKQTFKSISTLFIENIHLLETPQFKSACEEKIWLNCFMIESFQSSKILKQ